MEAFIQFTFLSLAMLYLVEANKRSIGQIAGEQQFTSWDDEEILYPIQTTVSDLGEIETRVALNGVKAIETTVPSQGENYLFIREAVKRNRMVWLVYKDNEHIINCNISNNKEDVDKLMGKFNTIHQTELPALDNTNENKAVDVSKLTNFRALLQSCRSFKKQVRALRIEKNHYRHNLNRQARLKETDISLKIDELNVPKIRSKRGMFSSMIYPGTKWCGAGDTAGGYHDLGENVGTDKCCREHDHCPYMIDSFSSNYNYWNYRLHTLSHCNCEERFKACLKSAGNNVANMVGYIYFNYVGTACFTLRPDQTCLERSWWGKCRKYTTEYTARVLETRITY